MISHCYSHTCLPAPPPLPNLLPSTCPHPPTHLPPNCPTHTPYPPTHTSPPPPPPSPSLMPAAHPVVRVRRVCPYLHHPAQVLRHAAHPARHPTSRGGHVDVWARLLHPLCPATHMGESWDQGGGFGLPLIWVSHAMGPGWRSCPATHMGESCHGPRVESLPCHSHG